MKIALDPGKKTGAAYRVIGHADFQYNSFVLLQWNEREVWPGLTDVWAQNGHIEELIVESSVGALHSRNPNPTPIKVCGVIEEWASQKGITVVYQQPSRAKHFWTNERLVERGLARKGHVTCQCHRHALDALRHLLVALKAF